MYTSLNSKILVASKYYRMDILFTILLVVSVFTLNWLMIGPYGIVGAAIATAIGLLLYNGLRAFYVWRKFGLHPVRKENFVVFALAGAVMALFEFIPLDFGIFVNIALRSVALLIVFILPLLILKIEPNFNEYYHNLKNKLLRK